LENERSVDLVGKRKIRRRRSVVVPTASALTYFLAAQGLAGLHGFAAFFFAAFFAAGAHGFASFFLPAQGLAALGAQGFVCWATAGSGAAASMPPTTAIDPSVWSDFLRAVMIASPCCC